MATRIAVINAGRVEQAGTPEDVYDRPATTFVAGFIGSPAMNMLPAAVSSESGMVRLASMTFRGSLWPGETAPLDVIAGVRPEHVEIVEHAPSIGLSAIATVDLIENLGSEQILGCLVDDTRIAVRAPRSQRVGLGDVVTLSVRRERVHIFDAETTVRLEWQPEHESTDPRRPAVAVASA